MTTFLAADPVTRRSDFLDWVRAQGITPEETYRIDVEYPTATVHQYEITAAGKKFVRDGGAAKRDPYNVTLTSPPPCEPILEADGRLPHR